MRIRVMTMTAAGVALALAMGGGAVAGDATRGGQLYAAQCGFCHGASGAGGPAGPALAGVVGRKAASATFPSYSPALKKAGWTWTAPKLDTYLASPQGVVPGTSMPIAVAKPADRADLVAYLSGLKGGAPAKAVKRASLPGDRDLAD